MNASADTFDQIVARTSEGLEPKLEELLAGEGRLNEAMRYAVLGGGKRFRPFLVLETAKLFDVSRENALHVAAAVELVHCYSLVHDDLPSMDNDDMRRGKASAHKKFDEATAILAGDALQSLAFEILAKPETHSDASVRTELIVGLAQAAGRVGMAGGQQLDMDTTSDIAEMAAMKTGALIRFSVLAGATLAGASEQDRRALEAYAQHLGLAFQFSDDLLDAEKDSASGKRTFATISGIPSTKEKLGHEVQEATKALEPFGTRAQSLCEAAAFMTRRTK